MTIVVFLIACNLLLSGFNFCLARKLWRQRSDLAAFNNKLVLWERYSRRYFAEMPLLLAQKRLETLHWRDRYQNLQKGWQNSRQVLPIVSLLLRAYRR